MSTPLETALQLAGIGIETAPTDGKRLISDSNVEPIVVRQNFQKHPAAECAAVLSGSLCGIIASQGALCRLVAEGKTFDTIEGRDGEDRAVLIFRGEPSRTLPAGIETCRGRFCAIRGPITGDAVADLPDWLRAPCQGTEREQPVHSEFAPVSIALSDFLAETPHPIPSLLGDGVIPRAGTVLLSGEGGVGKSTLAAQLCLALGAGLPDFLGLKIAGRAASLYVQREGNRDSFRARLAVAASSFGQPSIPVSVSAPPDSRRIQDWTALERDMPVRAEIAVIDTISRFALFDENSSRDWKEKVFLPAERFTSSTGCSLLFLHHWGKPADNRDGRHRTRGTSAMVDDCDTAMRLSRGPAPDLRVLEFDKVRSGPEPDPITLRFDRDRALFSVVSTEETAAGSDRRLTDDCGKALGALERAQASAVRAGKEFAGLSSDDWRRDSELRKDRFLTAKSTLEESERVRWERGNRNERLWKTA